MVAMETRPAMSETRCWEDLLRGRGGIVGDRDMGGVLRLPKAGVKGEEGRECAGE
jgi:hypothetical protein